MPCKEFFKVNPNTHTRTPYDKAHLTTCKACRYTTRMQTVRAFIAIELPPTIQSRLDALTSRLRAESGLSVRWLPAKNIHLTLKFLGEIPSTKIPPITAVMQQHAANFSHFQIHMGGIGAFPNPRRPRVIWVGLHAPESLMGLQKAIEASLIPLGFTPEARPFSPHLTLCRIPPEKQAQSANQVQMLLQNSPAAELGSFTVEHLTLFRSELLPAGAVYTHIARVELPPS